MSWVVVRICTNPAGLVFRLGLARF